MQIGIIIVGIVILCLMGFGMQSFFVHQTLHGALRGGGGAIGGGILTMVIMGIRSRIKSPGKEKTEEAEE